MSAASVEWAAQRQDSGRTEASLALSWSGGKDSALALLALHAEFGRDPGVLITTVTDVYNRISMHGVRRELLALQAQELGIPLVEVLIPPACPNEVYDSLRLRTPCGRG
jgi:diphthamide synthase (EF-2-diphthine--ammonia ligase)